MVNTVLVVDNDTATQELLKVAVIPLQLSTVTCSNGFEATQHLQEAMQLPVLILLNLRLPCVGNMDSYDTIRWIHQTPHLHHIPIIALVSGSQEEAQQAMDNGVTTCIGLPFRPADLLERIQAVLQQI